MLLTSVASAQGVDRRYAEEPTGGMALPLAPLAGEHDARAVTVNPGGNPFYAQPFMLHRTMIFGDMGLEAFKARLQTSRPPAKP